MAELAEARLPRVRAPTSAGPWRLAWRRLRRDRASIVAAGVVVVLALAVIAGGPVAERLLGHGPNDQFPYGVAPTGKPVGPYAWVYDRPFAEADVYGTELLPPPPGTKKTLLLLGADGLGRDVFLRLLYGGRVTLAVALGATLLALFVGVILGALGGWAGGILDAAVSRFTDLVMAFPYLLLIIVIASTANDAVADVTFGGLLNQGVLQLILLIGLFTWFYPARIVRTRMLSLRKAEFVEAAEMVGSGPGRIVRKHLLAHLVTPLLVYAPFAIATNVMIEVGVTFLGAGVRLPTASWGSILAETWGTALRPTTYDTWIQRPINFQPWLTVIPSIAIFVAVFAFNQLGEGLRSAVDPEAKRA